MDHTKFLTELEAALKNFPNVKASDVISIMLAVEEGNTERIVGTLACIKSDGYHNKWNFYGQSTTFPVNHQLTAYGAPMPWPQDEREQE